MQDMSRAGGTHGIGNQTWSMQDIRKDYLPVDKRGLNSTILNYDFHPLEHKTHLS